MSRNHDGYCFSKGNGAKNISLVLSGDLKVRILRLCNILEMNQSALLRFLINRGVDQLEDRLKRGALALRKQETAHDQ